MSARPFHERLLDEAIKPNAEALARILLDGDVAIVFFEVGDGPSAMRKDAVDGARVLGWRGSRVEVSRMTKRRAAKYADTIARIAPSDPAAGWLRRTSGPARIYVCAHVGTICVDYDPGTGYRVAPGTDDAAWMS